MQRTLLQLMVSDTDTPCNLCRRGSWGGAVARLDGIGNNVLAWFSDDRLSMFIVKKKEHELNI